MTSRQRQGAAWSLQNTVRAAVLLSLVLFGCSSLALPTEDAPAAGPEPAYPTMIAKRLQNFFKDLDTYDAFEISDFRWVHSPKGWTWLACVRFQDRGHRRTYAMFLKATEIIYSRYAVETDNCDAQNYAPFDPRTGGSRPASPGNLDPLH